MTDTEETVPAITEDPELAAAREKHGPLFVYDVGGHTLAFRKPTRLEFRAYLKESKDETLKPVADERFVQKLVVVPTSAQAFAAILDDLPAVHIALASSIAEACGLQKLEAKKL